MLWIELEGAFEASLRHVVLSEHERGESSPEAQARIIRSNRGGLGERREGIAEALGFERLRARVRERRRVLRGTRRSAGNECRECQNGGQERAPNCQGVPA